MFRRPGIDPTATLGSKVEVGPKVSIGRHVSIGNNVHIGANCSIGDYTIIYDNVYLDDHSTVGPFVTIGEPTSGFYCSNSYVNEPTYVGPNSLIRSYSIIYSGVKIAGSFESGHHVAIREQAEIGIGTRIGTFSDIQGLCRIGRYCRLHSNVHIAQTSTIGDFVWLFPYVVFTNDPCPPSNYCQGPTIEDFAVIATRSVLLPGVRVGRDAFVGANSLVKDDVEPEALVTGNPAKRICSVRQFRERVTGSRHYPWREYFSRGLPWDGCGYEQWAEAERVRAGRRADGPDASDSKGAY